ncbi:MAG: hypothetical protein KAQ68_06290 [Clostridiales bacterium]|nr:hypothetical protein [Clostridiales bacterium]
MNTLEKLNILCEKNSIDLKKDFRLHTNVKITNAYRLLLQLYYAMSISKVNNGKYDDLLDYVVENVSQYYNKQGAFPLEFVNETEKSLNAMQEDAKSYKYICIGHAHIDMNWLWGINETVSITHDTFRTVLDLMNQYPEFTFAQSQASVYHIMEQYFPEMIDEVKQRVKEGRWEVTASTWVEADRNMPNAESIARQLLYAKKYLSELLDIDPKSLNVDFEPDTFGHNANTPEILSQGGVKYYYHCRGYEEETLYRWQSKSGQKITSFCEPIWYNHTITGQRALMLAEFCEKNNMDSLLCVYGVGDHGGGPTRRDIERIIKMNTWPIFPEWKFGTFADFYALTDEVSDTLPVVDSELNFVFTGCYTSQSLIKKNNKKNEQDLKITEMWNTIAKNAIGAPYTNKGYEENWRMVMFNQFHDILPGSGIAATRHHASSLAQQVRGFTEISTNRNLRALSDNINTKNLVNEQDLTETISEGAGSGFGLNAKSGVQYSRHSGIERIFTVFNSLPYQRKEPVEITLWDWWGDQERIYFEDSDGNMIKHQLVVIGKSIYWGHFYHTYLVEVDVSATGYNTIIAKQHDEVMLPTVSFPQRRVNKHEPMVLENENIKAIFDNKARIVSLIDKSTGVDFADDQVIGLFRMITEDPSRGETAWVVGRYMDINDLEDNVKVTEVKTENVELRQSISFSMDVGESSSLMVSASLDNESHRIDFNVQCRWTEIGTKEDGVPQLQINVPVAYECDDFTYDIPLGYEYRK